MAFPATDLVHKSIEQIAAGIDTNRNVSIEFTNESPFFLSDPAIYMDSGRPYMYPPEIAPCKKDAICFQKKPHTACGAVGIIIYKMFHPKKVGHNIINSMKFTGEYICIYFCCSYSGKNYHALWLWEGISVSKNLFKHCERKARKEGEIHEVYSNKNKFRLHSTIGADGHAVMRASIIALQPWMWEPFDRMN